MDRTVLGSDSHKCCKTVWTEFKVQMDNEPKATCATDEATVSHSKSLAEHLGGETACRDVHGLSYELLMMFIHPYIENDVSNLL